VFQNINNSTKQISIGVKSLERDEKFSISFKLHN